MGARKGAATYGRVAVTSASPAKLLDELFMRALGECQRARECLAARDLAGKGRAVARVLDVVSELDAALDHKVWPELGLNLTRLYAFIQAKVARASLDCAAAPLRDVEKILGILRDAFAVAATRPQTAGGGRAP